MESRLPHTNDEQEVPISQHTGHHDQNEDEHHGEEKKSVFRRFKDKARKLKNTITNQGQGQDHDDVDDDDDEEEEDETVEAEVHGAPNAKVAQPKDNLERPSVITDTKPVASHVPPLTVPAGGAYGTNLSGQSDLGGQDVNPEKRESKIGQPTGMENEVTFDPSPTRVPTPVTEQTYENAFDSFENRGQDGTHGGLKSSTGKSTGMMEVPHAPSGLGSGTGTDPANDETKVTNQTDTGGKEAGLSQVQHSFDKMGIHNSGSESPHHPENLPLDTAGNQSTHSSSDTEKISSIDTPLAGFGSGSGSGSGSDPANYETKVNNPTHTGGKEAGLSQVQHSFDKMDIQDSGSERPEDPENLPHDTFAGNQSTALSGLGSEGKEAGLSQVQHSFDKMGIQDSGSERPEHPENLPHDTLVGNQSTGLSGSGSGTDPANYETKVTNPTHPGGKEAGLSQMQHSFDKMDIQDSGSERPEHPENLPHDTPARNQSTALSELGSGTDSANYETKVTNPTYTEGTETGLSQVQHSFDKTSIQDFRSERPEHSENLRYDTIAGNQPTGLSGLGSGSGTDSTNYETKVTNPTHTGDKEAGLSQVQHSFDKMGIQDSGSEHPEHPENLPHDTLSGNQSTTLSGLGSGSGTDPENYETKVTNSTHTGDKEAGLSQVQHSSDKMGIQDSRSEHREHLENLPHDTLAGNQSTALSGLGSGSVKDHENYETKVTNPTHTEGGKEEGLSQVQHSFDKTGIHNSGIERKRFDPEHPDNLPPNTLAGNQSTQISSYTEKISSMAFAAKDMIASKLGYSGEQPTTTESHENVKNSGSTATDYAHSITDKVKETSAPVNEKVVDAGTQ